MDVLPKVISGKVGDILRDKDKRKMFDDVIEDLDLTAILERQVNVLSGGELQRFAIAVIVLQEADIYMFDEPSSYLDVKQRLSAAHTIRELCTVDK